MRLQSLEADMHNYKMYRDYMVKNAVLGNKSTSVEFVSIPFRRYTPYIQTITDKAEIITGSSSKSCTLTMDEFLQGLDLGSWRCIEILYDLEAFRSEQSEMIFENRVGMLLPNAYIGTHVQFLETTIKLLKSNLVIQFETHKELFAPFKDRFITALCRTQMCKELILTETCTTQVDEGADLFLRLQNLRKFSIGAFTEKCKHEWYNELLFESSRVMSLAWDNGYTSQVYSTPGGKKVAKA